MALEHRLRNLLRSDIGALLLVGLVAFALHMLTNGRYGWHRDELATLDDARRLAWGYVAYPPITPLVARAGLALFGASLVGVRLFAVLAQCAAIVLAGLIAREMGASRTGQVITALAVATTAASAFMSATLMYVSIEYLWWVIAAYCLVRRLRTEDRRWWLGVGAAVGLGMMTKYTAAFLAAGIVVGVCLTPLRRDLRSKWLWAGAALAALIFLPNAIWQVRHDFISLHFLASIHARDVAIGRTDDFLLGQLYVSTNALTLPIWLAGLASFMLGAGGRRYRILGWMFLVPLVLFLFAQGRDYYLAPAYPMLLAGGTVAWERWLADRTARVRAAALGYACLAIAAWAVAVGVLAVPIAPINSSGWHVSAQAHDLFREEIGWREMVQTVAKVYEGLPERERPGTGILAGNYGEAGAIDLYGPDYGLPAAISGINSYWLRGPGDPPPETVIALGFQRGDLNEWFQRCSFASPITNPYGVPNEETTKYEGVFVCRGLRRPWRDFWPTFRWFG